MNIYRLHIEWVKMGENCVIDVSYVTRMGSEKIVYITETLAQQNQVCVTHVSKNCIHNKLYIILKKLFYTQ